MMSRWNHALVLIAAISLVLGACSQEPGPDQDEAQITKTIKHTAPRAGGPAGRLAEPIAYPKDDGTWVPYAPGEVVVKFKESVGAEQVDRSLGAELGLTRVKRRSRLGVDRMKLTTKETVEEAVARIKKDPRVIYAEPNYKIRLTNTPNDPRYDELWGMHNTGQTGGTAGIDIDAPEAWDISIGSYNVVVAVLDTGVDYNHPDLAANIWENEDEIPGNGIDDDNNGYIDDIRGWEFEYENNDPMDDYGHGTHCSGTIGGVGDNGIGVAGVNWRVKIMPVRIIGSQDLETYCTDATEGVIYAAENGADVMSCSWWTVQQPCQVLQDAVTYAEGLGSIIVAAAANEYADVDGPNMEVWPCEYPNDNIICVAAIDHNNNKADFSNWGSISVDVAAPGVDILSTTGGSYDTMSGTSMATPHTAGVVALMLSLAPDLTATEVKNTLFATVDPVPDLEGLTITGGRINAYRALQALSGVPLPPIALAGGNQTVATGSQVVLDGSSSFDPNQDPLTFAWHFYPPGHSSATLDDPTAEAPEFLADVCGDYQAVLTVNDGTFDSDPDTANVYVRNVNPYSIESDHPYGDNADETWIIQHPGAVTLSVHFSAFDTESGYDFVRILDGNDTEWAAYAGNLGEFSSVAIEGDTLKIHFTSDGSQTRDGFSIDAYYWCDAGNCAPGTGDCDGDPQNGCETDTSDDLNNCGWCGHACVFPHASAVCQDALCQIGVCDSGWTDCDLDPNTGCESNLMVDPTNCGGCGTVCGPYDNATPGCVDGDCAIGVCDPNWDDCDGNLANGCEMDVSTDVANCGACDNVCNLDHTGSHVCIDGICHPMVGACTDDPENIETVHPYADNFDDTWTIVKPGAAEISVHFSNYDTESGYDYVYIYDGNDVEYAVYNGALGDFQSATVPGNTIKVRLTTDGSVTRYGFVIDSVHYCVSDCEAPWANCDGQPGNGCEADTQADLNHCGGCGQICGAPNTNGECIDGICYAGTECQDGFGDCDGNSANGCEADFNNDPDHCGDCTTVCDPDHGCNAGICFPYDCSVTDYPLSTPHDYPANYDETFVITHPGAERIRVHFAVFSFENSYDFVYILDGNDAVAVTYTGDLGAFDSPWVQGDTIKIHATSDSYIEMYGFDIDTYETCTSGCPAGYADCDGNPGNGCETEVSTDPDNCGGCGVVCNLDHADPACVSGGCIVSDCHTGYGNCDGTDANGCESDVNVDPDNCGNCGVVCVFDHAGASCAAGTCELGTCDSGWTNCDGDPDNGCESDVSVDPDNCGACGYSCADNAPANTQSDGCTDSSCDYSCMSGFGDCDGNPANGCEAELAVDAGNCGTCGTVCAYDNAGASCVNSACVMGACDAGFGNCDTLDTNGCEADVTGDPSHCGDCVTACAYDNAQALCTNSVCAMGDCTAGFDDCDGLDANGCETDVSADVDNCGTCDNGCDFANAGASCVESACVMGACDDGWVDCDESPDNGCESDPASDPANCGGCGEVCDLANAEAGCSEGSCTIASCDEGFGDCDADATNGCEVNTGSDSANCGACGTVCGTGQSCTVGTCTCIDADEDGYGNDACGEDCNDDDASIHPGAEEVCGDDIDQNCDGEDLTCECPDADQDGYPDDSCGGDDCDDANASVYPGAEEICGDDIDQNCDGSDLSCTCADADQDGYEDEACGGDDCDDTNADIHPDAQEICEDDIDQNCDGSDISCSCPDDDQDGYRSVSCGGTDCDDTAAGTYPGAEEICGDEIDQDCDGYDLPCTCPDADGDTFIDANCGGDDCDDSDNSRYPGADEVCGDGIDQDCDGEDLICGDDSSGCGCSTPGAAPAPLMLLGLLGIALIRRRSS